MGESWATSGRIGCGGVFWFAAVFLALAGCQAREPPPLPTLGEGDTPTKSAPLPVIPASPYLNTRPEVKYVGDAACAECHLDKAESFARHPMGQSLTPVRSLLADVRLDAKASNPFELKGLRFSVERRGDRLYHQAQAGDVRATFIESDVQFALGSGRQGRAFLVNRDGFLFLSPISWFSGKQGWGPSPGFEDDQLLFSRSIGDICLYCHSNGATLVGETVNRYQEPIFHGYAIGCERCHGPGELHVAFRQQGEGREPNDYRIVNPRRLEPMLRDAVCEQCHLIGEVRVARRGRGLYDYRPGLPLHVFQSVFVRPGDIQEEDKSNSELQQFYESRCFVASKGRMGCIDCHDPHYAPPETERAAYYRERCVACHREQACALPLAARREKNPSDSCIDCHMPRRASADISHAALSDHRIARRPHEERKPVEKGQPSPPLRYFYESTVDPGDGKEINRDVGVALAIVARKTNGTDAQRAVAGMALPMLDAAVSRAADDWDAWEAKSFALGVTGNQEAALTVLDKVLAQSPGREEALFHAGGFAAAIGRTDAALSYYKRLLAVNPWHPVYQFQLARLLAKRKEWTQAAEVCERAIRLDPMSLTARQLRITCLVRQGEAEKARAELRTVLALAPNCQEELQRWFDTIGKK